MVLMRKAWSLALIIQLLYIAFRAPLVPVGPRTKALIAPIQKF